MTLRHETSVNSKVCSSRVILLLNYLRYPAQSWLHPNNLLGLGTYTHFTGGGEVGASCEEEVRKGQRVTLGHGFAPYDLLLGSGTGIEYAPLIVNT